VRTFVYIDGFNLYYGSVKGTPYRWLDLRALVRCILQPKHEILRIKYFTARAQAPDDDPDLPTRQDTYLRALRAHIPELEIYEGHFLSHEVTALLANPHSGGPRFTRIIKTEEKGSDVNLAVHLLNDAWLNAYECAVVISNDSDLAEAIRLVRRHHQGEVIGVVTPVRPPKYAVANRRSRTSMQLKQTATFIRLIREVALRKAQLPSPIPGTNINKPEEW